VSVALTVAESTMIQVETTSICGTEAMEIVELGMGAASASY
jgi:hypothetical protein